MAAEMPAIASVAYGTQTIGGANMFDTVHHNVDLVTAHHNVDLGNIMSEIVDHIEEDKMSTRRLIQVFIVDPDEKMPLADCLIYRGEQQFTDLTDEELFFEISVKDLLDKHNVKRKQTEDDTVNKDKMIYLKPIRIRDLKMVVVNIAEF